MTLSYLHGHVPGRALITRTRAAPFLPTFDINARTLHPRRCLRGARAICPHFPFPPFRAIVVSLHTFYCASSIKRAMCTSITSCLCLEIPLVCPAKTATARSRCPFLARAQHCHRATRCPSPSFDSKSCREYQGSGYYPESREEREARERETNCGEHSKQAPGSPASVTNIHNPSPEKYINQNRIKREPINGEDINNRIGSKSPDPSSQFRMGRFNPDTSLHRVATSALTSRPLSTLTRSHGHRRRPRLGRIVVTV